jgi:AcrR family transcriptional regulator
VERPYHHGALRTALLDEAQRILADDGVEAITLRELARRAGVSHGAPQRHFADRQALLDALATRGFTSLTAALRKAVDGHPPRSRAQLRAAMEAWVRFAAGNGPLLDLMFRTKQRTPDAARELFALTGEFVGDDGEVTALRLVLASTIEGMGALVAGGRLPEDRIAETIECALDLLEPALTG